jgi:hypothetical protein
VLLRRHVAQTFLHRRTPRRALWPAPPRASAREGPLEASAIGRSVAEWGGDVG